MDAENCKAAKLARKLGLDFTCEASPAAPRFVRFHIKFPDVRDSAAPVQNTVTLPKSAPTAKELDTPEQRGFQAYVKQVTRWRDAVRSFTIDPAPPGETGIIVAGDMGWIGDRLAVRSINKKNMAALRRFNDPEAMARRTALAQTNPAAGLRALADTLAMYGVKKPGKETLELKAALEKSCTILDEPIQAHGAPVESVRVDPSIYIPGEH